MGKRPDLRKLRHELDKAERLLVREKRRNEQEDTDARLFLVRFIKHNLQIRLKGGDRGPFNDWNYPQKVLAAYVVKRFAQRKNVRIVVHKSRQLGVSTVIQAIIFALVRHYPETAGMIIADLKDTAERIFDNCERFYEFLPQELKDVRPAKGDQAYKNNLVFDYPHRSEMSAATADTPRAAAGLMLCWVHISESAFIPNLNKVMLGVMPTVPSPSVTWKTLVCHESTANGKNDFYALCKRAQDPESEWQFFFFGLKDDPDAWLPIEEGETFELDEEEQEYADKWGMSLERMKWCRWKRKDECGNSWEYFNQEYPVDSELAFQFSGMPFFDPKRITEDLQAVQDPVFKGYLAWASEDQPTVKLVEDRKGPIEIWRHPERGHSYSAGGDVSLGVGADYSALPIFDDDTGEQVALYHSNRCEPGQFAAESFKLCVYYHTAFLGVENNSIGQGTIGPLRDGHGAYPQMAGGYPNLYMETRYDKQEDVETDRIGFSTSGKTKMPALEAFREAYNGGFIQVNARIVLLEMEGFAYDSKRGKLIQNYTDPKTGLHNDDCIMSMAIAYTMKTKARAKRYCAEPVRETW